jgi:hypothetical protein
MHAQCVIWCAIRTGAVEALSIGLRCIPRGVPVQSGIGTGMTQPPDPASLVMDVPAWIERPSIPTISH